MRNFHSALTDEQNAAWGTILAWKNSALKDGVSGQVPPLDVAKAFEMLNRAIADGRRS